MKKLIIIALAAALCLSLAACGGASDPGSKGTSQPAGESEAPESTPVMEVVIPVGTSAPEPLKEPENARLRGIIPVLDTIDSAYCVVTFLAASADEAKTYDVPDGELPELMSLIRAVDLDGCEYSAPEASAVTAEFWSAYDYNIVISLADSGKSEDGWYMYMLLISESGARDVVVARTNADGAPVEYHLFTAPDEAPLLALGDFIFTGAGIK